MEGWNGVTGEDERAYASFISFMPLCFYLPVCISIGSFSLSRSLVLGLWLALFVSPSLALSLFSLPGLLWRSPSVSLPLFLSISVPMSLFLSALGECECSLLCEGHGLLHCFACRCCQWSVLFS